MPLTALIEALEHRLLLATLPAGFTESLVASGLSSPSAMAFAPDGRLFVTEQGGTVRVIKNGQLLTQSFATVNEDSAGERGLLGVAFDPDFANNNYVYLYYTAATPQSHNVVSRVIAQGDQALPGSETILFELPPVGSAIWHMGGAINFGPDGKLYVAVGDHQVPSSAQSLNVPTGKILRINKDGTIPSDNPFFGQTTGVNRAIWALGLRNPFTTAFQPGTGRFYLNDVGEGTWEEVNQGASGANFGWPTTEGNFNQSQFPNFTAPIYTYSHSTDGCSVIGGAFYNPTVYTFPTQYHGKYFFMDFCSGWIRTIDPATRQVSPFATGTSFPTGLSISPVDGTVWYISRGAQTGGQAPGLGKVYRIENSSTAPAQIGIHPASQTIPIAESVTFSVSAFGTPPISYQWQRNNADIPGATGDSYTLDNVALTDSGSTFRVRVTNPFGTVTSNPATLTVTTNTRPNPQITLPAAGTTYAAGDTISFSGSATDAQDGTLPASSLTWQIDFHHDEHSHPFYPPTSGISSGSVVIPTIGETSANVWYRIYLTATDSQGLTRTVTRDILPRKSTFTIQTDPPGLALKLDAQPRTTPLTVEGVVGVTRSLEAPPLQTLNGVTYEFVSWSDGGAALHSISTPPTPTTYTALYRPTTATFLSDLSWVGTPINGWGPVERDRSNGETGATDGRTITLNGVTYAKGLGVHANSEVTYNLAGAYTRFLADVGVDDEVAANGSVVFQVFADGVKVFDSGTMTGNSATRSADVSVVGVQQLRLVVTDAGNGNGFDHADWAAARLLSETIVPYARINFTAPGGETYPGYLNDTGEVFGVRPGGRSFGWLQDNTDAARNRNSPASPDERYDSLTHLQKPEYPDARWEIAVPDGRYLVRIVAGDPDNFDGDFRVSAEGVLVVNGAPSTGARFVEGSAQLTVSDGRLTISNAPGAVNNKIAFIEIYSVKPGDDGDANLDGRVNIQDYFAIDRGYAQRLTGWANGDFDLSGGPPNADDYMLIDRAFLSQGQPLGSSPVLPLSPSADAPFPAPDNPRGPSVLDEDEDHLW